MNHQGTVIEKRDVSVDSHDGATVKKVSRVREPSDYEKSKGRLERFSALSHWASGAITAILGARFLVQLLGANPAAGFSRFIDAISTPLVLPFQSMFANPAFGASLIDSAAVVGLVVYPMVIYGLSALFRTIAAPSDPTGQAYTS